MRNIRPIRTETDYDWALAEVSAYFGKEPAKGSPDGDRFEVLLNLINAYEAKRWPIRTVDPVDAIAYAMQIGGRKQKELAELLGSKSRASEIMNRKRPLNLKMAHALHKAWRIPAEILIRPYAVDEVA
jgi:HTH-type transcriptional regulator/antitoxin HigA